MLKPKVTIIIDNKLKIFGCSNFSIDKDINKLSVSGTIELSLRVALKANNQDKKVEILELTEEIRQGSKIEIKAGYKEDKIHSLFKGYVTNIDPSHKLKLHVEDDIYKLRKVPVVLSRKNIGLKDLLGELLKDSGLSVHKNTQDIRIDSFNYKGNVSGALAKIKEKLSLTVFIEDNKVYAGGEQLNRKGEIVAVYGLNIFKHNIRYVYKDTNPLLVEVIGKKSDNTEVKVIVGEKGGSKQTFYKYNITDKDTLTTIANEKYRMYNSDGFKGNIGLLFIPFAEPGGSVLYKNNNYKSNDSGRYFITRVRYSCNSNDSLTQQVYLGGKLK
jgi:hypothetical protein